jgi:hypothetical protein
MCNWWDGQRALIVHDIYCGNRLLFGIFVLPLACTHYVSQIMFSTAITAPTIAPDPAATFPTPPVFVAEAADPAADAVPEPLLVCEPDKVVEAGPELVAAVDPVVDADAEAVAGPVEGVMLGPGPAVIMSPFPPGYVPPAAAVKSCGTSVSLLAK